MESCGGKELIYLSAKDLERYEKKPEDRPVVLSVPLVDPVPYNINKLSVLESPNTHIGPKFVTSSLTVHLPDKQNKIKKKIAHKSAIIAVGLSTLFLIACIMIVFVLPVSHMENTQEDLIPEEEDVPSDWYYGREDMNMSACPESYSNITANLVVVDSMQLDCDDINSCSKKIRSLPEGPHFYLKNGHIFEGLGWNCEPIEILKVVFLSEVLSDQEKYSFNMLLNLAEVIKMITVKCDVLPSCCMGESMGPSRSVMHFLNTLINFRERECVIKNPSCFKNNSKKK